MKKINVNYSPLHKSVNLRVVSGSPAQQYNATWGEYVPDYSLVPLVIQPDVRINDPDNIIPAGLKNASLTNIVWYKNQVSSSNAIETADTNYVVDNTSTDNRGRITVKKNVPEGEQLTLIFTATFLDTRTGHGIPVMGSIALTVSQDIETSAPRIVTSYPNGALLYPVTGQRGLKISAPLVNAKGEVKAKYSWFIYENAAYRELVAADGTQGMDTSVLWIPAKLLTRRTKIKSVATFGGNTYAREHVVGISYERYDVDIIVPGGGEIPASATSITVRAEVSTNAKVVKSPDKYFLIEWYDQSNNKLGEGETLAIAKEKYATADFGVDVKVSERYSGLQLGEKVWVLKSEVGDFNGMDIANALRTTNLGSGSVILYFQMKNTTIEFIHTDSENFVLAIGRVSNSSSYTIMIMDAGIMYSIRNGENSKFGNIEFDTTILKKNRLNTLKVVIGSSNLTMEATLNDIYLGSIELENFEYYGFIPSDGVNDVGITTQDCFLKSVKWTGVTQIDFENGNLEAYPIANPSTRFKFSLSGTADSELTQQIEI